MRARTATILQMDDMESGAVALDVVLGYYGLYVPAEELRAACGVSRDGSHPEKVTAAAQGYGMKAELLQVDLEGLRKIPTPFIAVTDKRHFVVIEGFLHRHVWVNDPARGTRRLPVDVLEGMYAGAAISMAPGPEFKRGGVKPSMYRSMSRRLNGSWGTVGFVALASLALIIPELAVPVFSKIFVDRFLVNQSYHWLGPLLVGLVLVGGVQALLIYLRSQQLLLLFQKTATLSTGWFFEHLLRLPMSFYTQRDVGDMSGRVSINVSVAQLMSGQVASALLSGLMGVFLLLMMWQFDAELTLITLFLSGLNFMALRMANNARVIENQRLIQAKYALYGISYAGLKTVSSLKASASEGDFFAGWASALTKMVNARQRLDYFTAILDAVPPALTALSTVAILGFGGMRVMEGRLTAGSLVAFAALAASFSAPITQFVRFGEKLQEAVAQMLRLDDVMQNEADPELTKTVAGPEVRLRGELELRNLTFGYDPNLPPMIQDLNLTLKPGQHIALVGATGSGKSTVGKLITGLYTPWKGEILLDGKPRSEWTRASLTCSLALVDQEIRLFRGTVAENLSMWDPTIPRSRLVAAARDADIHDVIASRPDGYDSLVYEGGTNFSGGQRQRLEIARALAVEPSLLVLDEATSALDARVEAEVVRNLRRRGCGCVVIAHRLSTVRDCDEILVLEHGQVVQRGTHEDLVGVPGPYQDLIRSE